MVNYLEEVKKLEEYEPGDFWTPEAGQYKVKALGELYDVDPWKEERKEGEKIIIEEKPRVAIEIEIEGKEKIWTMGKGKTPASSYGQICKLATTKNNTLKDIEFQVVVTNDGKKNSYTIVMI